MRAVSKPVRSLDSLLLLLPPHSSRSQSLSFRESRTLGFWTERVQTQLWVLHQQYRDVLSSSLFPAWLPEHWRPGPPDSVLEKLFSGNSEITPQNSTQIINCEVLSVISTVYSELLVSSLGSPLSGMSQGVTRFLRKVCNVDDKRSKEATWKKLTSNQKHNKNHQIPQT